MPKKILVCGGRNFEDAALLDKTLDRLHGISPIEELIHGAASGADSLAGAWARRNGVVETPVPADWKRHSKAAGPIRNSLMLTFGPDLVVSFPGGKGTADMVSKSRKKGVPVIETPPNGGLQQFYEPEESESWKKSK